MAWASRHDRMKMVRAESHICEANWNTLTSVISLKLSDGVTFSVISALDVENCELYGVKWRFLCKRLTQMDVFSTRTCPGHVVLWYFCGFSYRWLRSAFVILYAFRIWSVICGTHLCCLCSVATAGDLLFDTWQSVRMQIRCEGNNRSHVLTDDEEHVDTMKIPIMT